MLKAATGRVILAGALLLWQPALQASPGLNIAVTILPQAWTHSLQCYLDKRPGSVYPSMSGRAGIMQLFLGLTAGVDGRMSVKAAAPRVSPADGLAAFRAFLKTEFSEENLEFWLACEDFKKTRSAAKLASKAQRIFEEFIDVQAPREVNIDFQTRELTRRNVQEPSLSCFDQAQGKVHSLMEKDSYPRFLRSKIYTDLLSQTQRRLS
uniref:Regulator of G-protein signaling 8 n=2 Tax=Cyanistes caeruleus TaxID=156563 RepID=A0A8C0VJL1_CYACU